MPDFGLTDALAAALKGAKSAEVMRPAERVLAEGTGATAADAGPGAARAAGAAQAPAVAPPPMQDIHIQAPIENPSLPPQNIPNPPPEAAAGAPGTVPAPQPAAAAAVAASPPGAAPDASAGLPASSEPPGAPVLDKASPSAVAGVLDPADTSAGAPVAPANKLPPGGPPPAGPSPMQVQAKRFLTANLSDFPPEKLDMTHMPNVDVMQTPDGLKAGILQVADDNEAAITKARGGEIGDQQLTAIAQDLAVNADQVRQSMEREFGVDQAKRPALLLAARMVEVNEFGKLAALSDPVAAGTETSEQAIAWEQQSRLVQGQIAQVMGAKAMAGRSLRVLGIPVGLPPEVMDHVAQVLKQNNPDRQAVAQAIKLAGTPGGIADILAGTSSIYGRIPKAGFGLLQRIFINGILSGPPTWAKIFIGNNFNLALNTGDILAAGVGRGIYGLAARLGRFPNAAEGAQISDAIAHIHGVISGGADALRVAGRVMRTGQSMDGILRSQEGAAAQSAQSLAQHGPTATMLPEIKDSYFGSIARVVDNIIDAPGSRIIGPIDDFTKTLGFRGYLHMTVLREVRAALAAGTLKPGDVESFARNMVQNPSPEIEQAAEAWGHRLTFQTPFGPLGESFQKVLQQAPALRFIFPFMRTATNIFKQSLIERTPLAVFSSRILNQLKAGGFEGDLAKSRLATGTAVGSMLAWMAIHDRITGSAPKDPKERGEWGMDGRTPYSIRITDPVTGKDEWRSYQWLEPMASVAGAVADAVTLMSYIHREDSGDSMVPHDAMMDDAAANIMASVITNTGDKTYMQGAAKFSEMYNDPKRAFAMWFDETAASAMPFSGATKFLRNEQDPYMRQAFTLMDKIRDQLPTIPGVLKGSKTLMPRLDVFGEPIKNSGGNSILGPLSPFAPSPVKHDPVADELQAVMAFTHVVPVTAPAKQLAMLGNGRGLQDGQGMRLTPREYYEYTKLSRGSPIFDGGKLTFHDKLEQTINGSLYQASTPAERVVLLEHVQNAADKIGRELLFKQDPEFRERMLEWTAEVNQRKYNQ